MSNKFLYAGIFCCCTGFLVPLGLALIGLYVYSDYTNKYKTPVEQVDQTEYKMDEYSNTMVDSYK